MTARFALPLRPLLAAAILLAALVALAVRLPAAAGAPTELLLSEYVEGSGSNKALEIYNGTPGAVSLTGSYDIQIFANGSPTATATIPLTGTVASGEAFVLVRSAAGRGAAGVCRSDNDQLPVQRQRRRGTPFGRGYRRRHRTDRRRSGRRVGLRGREHN